MVNGYVAWKRINTEVKRGLKWDNPMKLDPKQEVDRIEIEKWCADRV